jgi:hypothetical protein
MAAVAFSKLLTVWSDLLHSLGPTIKNTYDLGRVLMPDARWAPSGTGTRSDVEEMAYNFWCYFRHIQKSIKMYEETNKKDFGLAHGLNSWEELILKLGTAFNSSGSTDLVSTDEQKKIITEFPLECGFTAARSQ